MLVVEQCNVLTCLSLGHAMCVRRGKGRAGQCMCVCVWWSRA